MNMTIKNKSPRTRAIAIIHIGIKQLNIPTDDGDDDTGELSTYRKMLKNLTGKISTGKMSSAELHKVIQYLEHKGFKVKPKTRIGKHPGTPNTIDREPQIKKIEALLAEAGRPWAYAVSMAKRMYKRDRLEFCDTAELQGIIVALIADARKHGRYTG